MLLEGLADMWKNQAPTSQVLTASEKAKLNAILDIRSAASPLSMSGTELEIDLSAYESGEYFPTVTNGVNISATANEIGYAKRSGEIISVTVGMTVTPLLAVNTPTSFEIDLILPSNLGSEYDCIGSGCFAGGMGSPVIVSGSTANKTAVISFASTLAGPAELRVVFMYKLIA